VIDFPHGAGRAEREKANMATAHAQALDTKHAEIERRIAAEMRRPLPDLTMIQKLKKAKLRLKDALSRS
jgi:hypothetical protein